jgi:hypothetical protein
VIDTIRTLCELLTDMAENLPSTTKPDDPSVHQAMALAIRAGTATTIGPAAEDWASYTEALRHAVRATKTDFCDIEAIAGIAPPAGADNLELRRAAIDLVKQLADLYATAAAGTIDSNHRNLRWSRVAHYLDDAAAELG